MIRNFDFSKTSNIFLCKNENRAKCYKSRFYRTHLLQNLLLTCFVHVDARDKITFFKTRLSQISKSLVFLIGVKVFILSLVFVVCNLH